MEKLKHLITPEIMSQIMMTQKYLVEHPLFFNSKRRAECRELQRNANRHSVEMEISTNIPHYRKERKTKLQNLTNAQRYLDSTLSINPKITEDIIRKTAGQIHGSDDYSLLYRNVSAFANRYNYQYVDYPEIPNEMFLFLDENNGLGNNIERAVHSHLHTTRIHPFLDGNGRLARLVSNSLLSLDNLPPVEIFSLERKKYCDLINAAQREYREERRLGTAQLDFYNYLALKIQCSLNKIGNTILK